MMIYVVAILCVFSLAFGQILFKLSSTFLTQTGSFFAFKTAAPLFGAFVLYGITSIVWVLILQKVELSRIYPFMALTFLMVPLFSYFALGERISLNMFLGSSLIVIGIWVALYQGATQ